jgi:hypothetical protein
MGSTPYHAPDLNFLDFVGLVDKTIARARARHGLHFFVETGNAAAIDAFRHETQSYFYSRSPHWVLLVTYAPRGTGREIAKRYRQNPVPESLGPTLKTNKFHFGLYNNRFRDRYAHVRTWQTSLFAYVSLFQRRDLAQKVPGEVVLDALPSGVGGVKATYSEGLELLGSELNPAEIIEGREQFVTVWHKVPGPMDANLLITIDVDRPGSSPLTLDALPGDWMYPADRWQPGEIVESRIPVRFSALKPGTYDVYFRMRVRHGENLRVTRGAHDSEHRLMLGTVTVRARRPLLDRVVPETEPAVQRKYPARIRK